MKFELKTFENLLEPGVNSRVLDVQGEKRKKLYDYMLRYDMPRSTSYYRIFRSGYGSGFSEWELMGVFGIIRCFCEEKGLKVPSERGMKKFYLVNLDGMREQFCAYMLQRGMSRTTVIYRFKNWNFKPWEMRGIRSIISELCNQSA